MVTLHRLEGYGFIWIIISIPIGLVGLIIAIVNLFRWSKQNLANSIGGLLCVLINIPVLIWIIAKQSEIEQRAYVRILNQTEADFAELWIANSSSKGDYKTLSKERSKTVFFYPKYLSGDFESVPLVDIVTMVIKSGDKTITRVVPEIHKGECIEIVVDREFNIVKK